MASMLLRSRHCHGKVLVWSVCARRVEGDAMDCLVTAVCVWERQHESAALARLAAALCVG